MPAIWENLGTGAPIIAILSALSILSIAVILLKIAQLWFVRSGAALRRQAIEQWKSGEKAAARRHLDQGKSPADSLLLHAMTTVETGHRGGRLEAELQRQGNQTIAEMNSHIRLLDLIAMISPLLGLLGTVLGMIQSFQELELAQGAANASVLAGGIWQALLTTAAGLLVAIPAAVAAGLFAARIDAAAQDIENTIGLFLLTEDGD